MPYAPSVNDNSGQILAQGISSGVSGILAGMQQKAAERQKKEEEKRLQNTLGPLIESMSGGKIKLEDAPKESWPILFQAAQQEQQRPIRELQQRNAELETLLQAQKLESNRQEALARLAAGNPDPVAAMLDRGVGGGVLRPEAQAAARASTPVSRYLAAGGRDAALLNQLIDANKSTRPFVPSVVDLGGGRAAMTTSDRSAVPLSANTLPKEDVKTIQVGDRTYTVGPGNRYFDEKGKPVKFAGDGLMELLARGGVDGLLGGMDASGGTSPGSVDPAPSPAAAAVQEGSAGAEEMIRMVAPNGSVGSVPKSRAAEAEAAGYRRI